MVTVVAEALDDEDDAAPGVLAVVFPVSASVATVPDCEIDHVVYDE
jgi:hypothetical protein